MPHLPKNKKLRLKKERKEWLQSLLQKTEKETEKKVTSNDWSLKEIAIPRRDEMNTWMNTK